MRDHQTRVLLVRFTSDRDPRQPRLQCEQIRFAAVMLFPPEVKRQLATLEAATARATELPAKSSSATATGLRTGHFGPYR
jgi:hypothetical protein